MMALRVMQEDTRNKTYSVDSSKLLFFFKLTYGIHTQPTTRDSSPRPSQSIRGRSVPWDGQCQSPWTRGVGQFHGALDINAPPSLEVNNSAHSITCTGTCARARTHICEAIITLTFTFRGRRAGVIWMTGVRKSPFSGQR